MTNTKISVIGAGNVGATAAQLILINGLADVVLLDIDEGIAKGKALDLLQAIPLYGYNCKIIGTAYYKDTKNSDIVIITAGIPRKPGMSRDDLLGTNAKIMKAICTEIKSSSPNAIVIVVSNPLDTMTQLAYDVLDFPKERVMGMAGVLDSARYKAFLSDKMNISAKDIEAMVMGGHGDTMVPLPKKTKINGKLIEDVLDKENIDKIVDRTKNAGAEVVSYLKTGSAYYAPAASAVHMAAVILQNKKELLAASVLLEGEFGHKDIFVGVPIVLGSKGVEKIEEIELSDNELKLLSISANAVKENKKKLEEMNT